MHISRFKTNHFIQSLRLSLSLSLRRTSSSTQSKKTRRPSQTTLDLPLDSLLSPSKIPSTDQSIPPASHPDSSHPCADSDPVSTSLLEFQASSKICSSAQVMDRAIHRVIPHSLPPQPSNSRTHPPIPSSSSSSSSSFPTHHKQPIQPSRAWNQIYTQFLTSSSNHKQFSDRIGDLVNKRLPKTCIDEILQLHSSQTDLISVESYNQLIEHSYKSEKYHHARSLIAEMKERGIERNQKTLELIACSYQALNKWKGVQLTLNAIKSDGKQLSGHGLTSLFSIRPRRSSKLKHFDDMDVPPATLSSPLTEAEEHQRWMPIDEFFKSNNWNVEDLRKDGRALVTVTKRLMETGRWKEARQFVGLILRLDLRLSKLQKTLPAINSYWSTSLLDTLVFGLYNLKRQTSKAKKNIHNADALAPRVSRANAQHAFDETQVQDDDGDETSNRYLQDLEIDSVFEFVESFVDQNQPHMIKLNPKILLNCLRIQTRLAPSEIKVVMSNWTRHYGLEANLMGSRLGIRILHIFSAWFINQIRSIKTLLDLLASNSSSDPSSLRTQINAKTNALIHEYRTIDQEFLTCLESKNTLVHRGEEDACHRKHQEGPEQFKMIERMILNGPIDGRFIQSHYRFISFQDLKSIHLSLKKIFKIHGKIQKLLDVLRAGHRPSDDCGTQGSDELLFLGQESQDRLEQFTNPIKFKSSFYRVLDGLRKQIDQHQSRATTGDEASSSPAHPEWIDTKDRARDHDKYRGKIFKLEDEKYDRIVTLDQNNNSNNDHKRGKKDRFNFQIVNNFIVCWASEHIDSNPIYLKPHPPT